MTKLTTRLERMLNSSKSLIGDNESELVREAVAELKRASQLRCMRCDGVLTRRSKYHFEGRAPFHDRCPRTQTRQD